MFYPLVSVIIPVYQAEKFLTECVESVRKQDYSELEIVLVNDGSTDRSNQMCEELAAADPRIRVIHQNNKGSGAARNAGIKEATGKYLLFLDAELGGPATSYPSRMRRLGAYPAAVRKIIEK